jgi:3-dehydroquinate dehydratase type I
MPSRPRIIGVVTAMNRGDDKAWQALEGCDLAELRADTLLAGATSDAEVLPGLLRAFREEGARRLGRIPGTLVTLRLRRDGGSWPDERADERVPVWESLAASAGSSGTPPCEWVDIEAEAIGALPPRLREAFARSGVKVLVSHHDFRGGRPLPALRGLWADMLAARPEGVKLALTAADRPGLRDLLALAREVAAGPALGSVFSMGAPGRATRVLGPLLGCPFTYGYLTGGPVAPGQLSASELRAFFAGARLPDSEDPETLLNWAEGRLMEVGIAR